MAIKIVLVLFVLVMLLNKMKKKNTKPTPKEEDKKLSHFQQRLEEMSKQRQRKLRNENHEEQP